MSGYRKDFFWFTNDFGIEVADSFYGTLDSAAKYIRNFMDKKLIDSDVYINCGDDVVGVVFF